MEQSKDKKPRGRRPLHGQAMSVAERKRRSRALQIKRATQNHQLRLPKALSVEIDASLHQKFRTYCQQQQLTQAEALEKILAALVLK